MTENRSPEDATLAQPDERDAKQILIRALRAGIRRSRLSEHSFWLLPLFGVFFLITSIALHEHYELEAIKYTKEELLSASYVSWHSRPLVWISFLRELGFASLIAFLIGYFIERVARFRQAQMAKAVIDEVSINVLKGVLGISVPRNVMLQTVNDVFSAPVIRQQLRLNFKLDALDNKNDFSQKYLKLNVNSSYRLENVSGKPIEHDIRIFIPKPAEPGLRELSHIISMSIDGSPLSKETILQGDKNIADSKDEKRYLWKKEIDPDNPIEVTATYDLIKEISDSELWVSLIPTSSIEVIVECSLPTHIWDVDALHSGNLTPVDGLDEGPRGKERVVFRTKSALLPYQGVYLWWRPRPKGGNIEADKS